MNYQAIAMRTRADVDFAVSLRKCRVCLNIADPSPGDPIILSFGGEFAHESCARKSPKCHLVIWEERHVRLMLEVARLRARAARQWRDHVICQFLHAKEARISRAVRRLDFRISILSKLI